MARINTSFGGGRADAPLAADASPASAATRKRGRKAKADVDESRPTKRARTSSKVETGPQNGRRGRSSANSNNRQQGQGKQGPSNEETTASANSSRGAKISRSKSDKTKKATKTARPATSSSEAEATQQRKAGRPRKSDASVPANAAERSQKLSTRGQKAAKPKTITEIEPITESGSPASKPKGKRGRKPSQLATEAPPKEAAEVEKDAESEPQSEPESEPEPEAEAEAEAEVEAEAEDEEETEGVPRRRRQSTGVSAGHADPPFRQLVPRTRLIPMSTMAKKWAPLERDAIAAVHALLEECARPVISHVRAAGGGGGVANERRQEQTRQAISSVTRRLRSKLVKGIPFPPGTVVVSSRRGRLGTKGPDDRISSGIEADFNYERVMEGAQALEQQLTPLQHAIGLLERERKREEAALEADYAALRELETNAQVDLRTWRERARKAHVLAPVVDGDRVNSNDLRNRQLLQVELVARKPAMNKGYEKDENGQQSGGLFENLSKDLSTAAAQLSSHMDSMKANLQQIDGVVPAIIKSKSALQHVLHEHLDPLQYERIMLGR